MKSKIFTKNLYFEIVTESNGWQESNLSHHLPGQRPHLGVGAEKLNFTSDDFQMKVESVKLNFTF